MTEHRAGGDRAAAAPLEQPAPHAFEAISQAMSGRNAGGDDNHVKIAQSSSDMVASGKLPAVEIHANGDHSGRAAHTSDQPHYTPQQLESGAQKVIDTMKHQGSPEELAKDINQAMHQGVPLDKLVDQINKDWQYGGGLQMRHAALDKDAKELYLGNGLGGITFFDKGDHVHVPTRTEFAASQVEASLKDNSPPQFIEFAINNALAEGVSLDKIVDQINKDMPYPKGIELRHAVHATDADGKEHLYLGMGPFAGPSFDVKGNHIEAEQHR